MDGLCKCGCGQKTSLHRYGPKIHQPRDYISGHNVKGRRWNKVVDGKQTCTKCGETKPLEEFVPLDGYPGQYRGICKDCNRARLREYMRRSEARRKERHGSRKYGRKGITREEWEERFRLQGCVCAICGVDRPGPSDWHIDHDHSCCPQQRACPKCVRGILCHLCNLGLGAFRDSTDLLAAAAAYLDAHELRANPIGSIHAD